MIQQPQSVPLSPPSCRCVAPRKCDCASRHQTNRRPPPTTPPPSDRGVRAHTENNPLAAPACGLRRVTQRAICWRMPRLRTPTSGLMTRTATSGRPTTRFSRPTTPPHRRRTLRRTSKATSRCYQGCTWPRPSRATRSTCSRRRSLGYPSPSSCGPPSTRCAASLHWGFSRPRANQSEGSQQTQAAPPAAAH